MQPWHRWREPLAVALLVALALMLVVRGIALGLAYDARNTGGYVGAIPGGDELLLMTAAIAVLWCTTPVRDAGSAEQTPALSPHAWPIAVAGLVVVGLTVLGWFVLAVANVGTLVSWPTPHIGFVLLVIEGLLRLAIPVAALVAVVLAVRRAAAARTTAEDRPSLTATVTEPDEVPAVTAAPDRLPAAWQADEATGAVWLTADDAAQGQPGLSWADPAATAGAVTSGAWAPPPTTAEEGVAPPRAPSHTAAEEAVAPPRAPAPTAAEDDDLR